MTRWKSVRDNGIGIPADVRDRVSSRLHYQATGKGTGLGLSITYDIVTQQHGGTIVARTMSVNTAFHDSAAAQPVKRL